MKKIVPRHLFLLQYGTGFIYPKPSVKRGTEEAECALSTQTKPSLAFRRTKTVGFHQTFVLSNMQDSIEQVWWFWQHYGQLQNPSLWSQCEGSLLEAVGSAAHHASPLHGAIPSLKRSHFLICSQESGD